MCYLAATLSDHAAWMHVLSWERALYDHSTLMEQSRAMEHEEGAEQRGAAIAPKRLRQNTMSHANTATLTELDLAQMGTLSTALDEGTP